MTNVSNFNEFIKNSEDNKILESIFQKWELESEYLKISLNESILEEGLEELEDDDERELTSGEKAAITKGEQILTKEQLAAMYLRAKELEEDDDGKYTIMIQGIEGFSDTDRNGNFTLTSPALADAIGVDNGRTVTRTISKFRNLISGEGATPGEVIYPKLQKAFDVFDKSRDSDIAALASGTIQDTSVTTARDDHESQLSRTSKAAADRAVNDLLLGKEIYGMVNQLRGRVGLQRAQKMVIDRMVTEKNMDRKRILAAYEKYLKSVNLSKDFKR